MKHKILYGLMSLLMLCAFIACSDDDGPETEKISIPKDQPTNISLAANETGGQITVKSDFSISAWVSDKKDGAPVADIEWITVDSPINEGGLWVLNFTLQTNTSGSSRTAYIVVVAEDEKISFKITQSDEYDEDIPNSSVTGRVEIKCEAFEDFYGNGSYQSDGESYYELTFDAGMPRLMICKWTDDMEPGPGQSGDTKCEVTQVTKFLPGDNNRINATMTDYKRYLPSGREETSNLSRHQMELFYDRRVAKSGSYEWTDEPGTARWIPSYSSKGYIEQMKQSDTDGDESVYFFTWKDDLLMKIEEKGTGNTVTFSYANPSLVNLYSTFDLNWILGSLETLDFAAGDVTKIWASLGYLGMRSNLYATEISEYRKEDNITYTCRMNYELHTSGQIEVNVAHLVNGVQESYKVWEFKFFNMR